VLRTCGVLRSSLGLPYEGRTFRSRRYRSKFVREERGRSDVGTTAYVPREEIPYSLPRSCAVFSWCYDTTDPYPSSVEEWCFLGRRQPRSVYGTEGTSYHLGATATTMESCSGSPKPESRTENEGEMRRISFQQRGTQEEKEDATPKPW